MTYAEFEAFIDRKKQQVRLEWYRAALIAAVIVNSAGKISEKVVKPEDFMPKDPDEKEKDLSKLSPEEQAAFWMNLFGKQEIHKH